MNRSYVKLSFVKGADCGLFFEGDEMAFLRVPLDVIFDPAEKEALLGLTVDEIYEEALKKLSESFSSITEAYDSFYSEMENTLQGTEFASLTELIPAVGDELDLVERTLSAFRALVCWGRVSSPRRPVVK